MFQHIGWRIKINIEKIITIKNIHVTYMKCYFLHYVTNIRIMFPLFVPFCLVLILILFFAAFSLSLSVSHAMDIKRTKEE